MQLLKWSRTLAPCLALIGVLVLQLSEPQLVRDLRFQAFDALQRLHPRPYTDAAVRVIDLDDESLERLGQWPWPRTQVAHLVDALNELGAAAIAFDIVFAEPDRTSPSQLFPVWRENGAGPELGRLVAKLPDHDDLLAEAFARAPVVTGFVAKREPGGRQPRSTFTPATAGDDPRQFLPFYAGAVTTLPKLEAAASGNGSFALDYDRDGVIRRVPLLYLLNDQLYFGLAAEALRVATGSPTSIVRATGASREESFGTSTGITEVRIAPSLTVPTDAQGRVWLHYTKPVPERMVSAWRVLDRSVDPALIDGHIVLIGTSAEGLRDIRTTPLDAAAPGVTVHAQLLEQILTGHYLERPDWADGAEILITLCWGLLLIMMIRRANALASAAVGVIGVAGAFGCWWLAFEHAHVLLDPVMPSLAAVAVYLSGSLVNYLQAELERSRIRGAFSRYVSPRLVKELARHPERLRLGGETRTMSVLFCDLRGFTSLSETMDAQGLTRVLNVFLTPMTDLILKGDGTIDKYMGDCIMAFWNAPLDDPKHAAHACAVALKMEHELAFVNEKLRRAAENEGRPHVPLRIGIGINSGQCCVGNMGSDQRFDYSVIGDEVNLASRLEGQSKTYGVTTVIGENTREAAEGFALIELDLIRVKGKREPVRIHALLGTPERRGDPDFQELSRLHEELLKAYRELDWQTALERADRCELLAPHLAGLYELYRERIEEFKLNPPPADWDRVYTATSK